MYTRRLVLTGICAMAAAPAWADTPFAVGQVWTLRPPMNPEARVRIGRIEDNGATIHISLWGADIPDTGGAIASPLVAGHLPITADALRASVDRQVDDTPPGDLGFDEGFATWREARGGVFTLTVPEIVNVMLRTVQQGQARSK